jgi:phage baseplate assembly protein V
MIRGIVTAVIEGVIKRFSASGRSDETFDNREYFQHYGFTSRPLSGSELIIIQEGNQIVAIASDDRRYRLALENGEVALYDHLGQRILLKADGIMQVVAINEIHATAPLVTVVASTKIVLDTPLVHCTGDMSICGGFTSSGSYGSSGGTIQTPGDVIDGVRSMADDRAIYNGHTHPGDSGGTTGTPNQQE